MSTRLEVIELGRQSYHDTLELQRALRLERIAGTRPDDMLLLVEHEPVFTLGRGTAATSLPEPVEALRRRGAVVIEIERGGDVTWHGPGQLVGYPIIDLSAHRQDLHWYLRTLETVLIDALASFGIEGRRVSGRTGVWVGDRKIASLGIHVKQWVTMHGFALNVDADLGWFDHVVPCGIDGVVMTSVARELGDHSSPDLRARACAAVVDAFSRAFSFTEVDGHKPLR